jgi:hypothetical protein
MAHSEGERANGERRRATCEMKFLDTPLNVKGKYMGLSRDGDEAARQQNGKRVQVSP